MTKMNYKICIEIRQYREKQQTKTRLRLWTLNERS